MKSFMMAKWSVCGGWVVWVGVLRWKSTIIVIAPVIMWEPFICIQDPIYVLMCDVNMIMVLYLGRTSICACFGLCFQSFCVSVILRLLVIEMWSLFPRGDTFSHFFILFLSFFAIFIFSCSCKTTLSF